MTAEIDSELEAAGVAILPPRDYFEVCEKLAADGFKARCLICDPWFEHLAQVKFEAASSSFVDYGISAPVQQSGQPFAKSAVRMIEHGRQIADHIFVWGRPLELAAVVSSLPAGLNAECWVTWHYQNGIRITDSWKPTQLACLHIVRQGAAPSRTIDSATEDVIIADLVGPKFGFRQQGEKPVEAFEKLILMSTDPGDLVVDLTCGSGTTGEAARNTGRRALLGDISNASIQLTETRLGRGRISL